MVKLIAGLNRRRGSVLAEGPLNYPLEFGVVSTNEVEGKIDSWHLLVRWLKTFWKVFLACERTSGHLNIIFKIIHVPI